MLHGVGIENIADIEGIKMDGVDFLSRIQTIKIENVNCYFRFKKNYICLYAQCVPRCEIY